MVLSHLYLLCPLSILTFHCISNQILWENRKRGDRFNDCLVSIDCTDCQVLMQRLNPASFKTHKFKTSGLRYELAICILTGDIVSVVGPLACGDWPDINIFRFFLKYMLEVGERVEADDGYIGDDPTHTKIPKCLVHDQDPEILYVRSRVRKQHETANKRIKQFNCMATVFRHNLFFHAACFRACAVLTQLSIESGHPLFEAGEYLD